MWQVLSKLPQLKVTITLHKMYQPAYCNTVMQIYTLQAETVLYCLHYSLLSNIIHESLSAWTRLRNKGSLDTTHTSLSLAGVALQVRHSSRKSSATHSDQCVQYFMCPNTGMAASVWDFNMHTDVDQLDACNCTQGLYGHLRVCAGSGLLEKNLLLHRLHTGAVRTP